MELTWTIVKLATVASRLNDGRTCSWRIQNSRVADQESRWSPQIDRIHVNISTSSTYNNKISIMKYKYEIPFPCCLSQLLTPYHIWLSQTESRRSSSFRALFLQLYQMMIRRKIFEKPANVEILKSEVNNCLPYRDQDWLVNSWFEFHRISSHLTVR